MLLFSILFFIFVTSVWCFFMMSFVVWIRLEDPTTLLFFPSVRVVGFSFSLPPPFIESYSFLCSSALICSLKRQSPFGMQSASSSVFLETSSSFLSSQLIVSCEKIVVCLGVVTFHSVGE